MDRDRAETWPWEPGITAIAPIAITVKFQGSNKVSVFQETQDSIQLNSSVELLELKSR